MRTPGRMLSITAAALLALSIAACFNPFRPRVATGRGVSEPAPTPDSPRALLHLFQWCWEHRAIAEYREIFTDDFRFGFSTTDSTGTAYLERGFTRDDELESATHLFLGGDAHQPRANRITMDFDPPDLVAFDDSRPGKNGLFHKEIFTHVIIKIETDDGVTNVSSSARFFVVSGDSALIPQELKDRGFGPDPHRWYIERYEEQGSVSATAGGIEGVRLRIPASGAGGAAAASGRSPSARATEPSAGESVTTAPAASQDQRVTWGFLKALYR